MLALSSPRHSQLTCIPLSRSCHSHSSCDQTPILSFSISHIVNHQFTRKSPAKTMSSQDIHKAHSSTALDMSLALSSSPPLPPSASDTCVAGKKHTSTPPPPPIPARSSRRPVSVAMASGRKLFKSTGDQLSFTESSESGELATLESTRKDVAELHGDRMRPFATGVTQARDGHDKPCPQRK